MEMPIPDAMKPVAEEVAKLHALFQNPHNSSGWFMCVATVAQGLFSKLREAGCSDEDLQR